VLPLWTAAMLCGLQAELLLEPCKTCKVKSVERSACAMVCDVSSCCMHAEVPYANPLTCSLTHQQEPMQAIGNRHPQSTTLAHAAPTLWPAAYR
jgi:hypothetical protein